MVELHPRCKEVLRPFSQPATHLASLSRPGMVTRVQFNHWALHVVHWFTCKLWLVAGLLGAIASNLCLLQHNLCLLQSFYKLQLEGSWCGLRWQTSMMLHP
jgi:hypothetical protein